MRVRDGRMIFKPLSLSGNRRDSLGGLHILHRNDRFEAALLLHRVLVHLDKSVNRVDPCGGFRHPFDAMLVECFEISGFVITNQLGEVLLLRVILRHLDGFPEPARNLLQSRAVHSPNFPGLFDNLVVLLQHLGVQPQGETMLRITLREFRIVFFGLRLRDPFIKIDR